MSGRDLNLFIIAGEASGDILGAALMRGLRKERRVTFTGVGGTGMRAAGLSSLFEMSDLSVMGLVEILPKIPKLLKRVRQTAEAAVAAKPDAIITIDSPDFCFRVVKTVKETFPDIPVIHYVAPSVWAWRPERAEKMAAYVDHVLALLPFEPPYMKEAGMSCDFVGHPAAFEPVPDQAAVDRVLGTLALQSAKPVLTVLPGSRRGEIRRMGPILGQAVAKLRADYPDLQIVVPVAPGMGKEVRRIVARWPGQAGLLEDADQSTKSALYAGSRAAIATSGTVALELAAAACPMVVAYKANWATTRMVKKLAKIDTANLINIVTKTRVIPEFLFEAATPDAIAAATRDLLEEGDRREEQCRASMATMHALGRGVEGAENWAATSVLRFLDARLS